ncbi:MAG: hypothetical protein U1E83_00745 [Methylotetracoccus sp.]
MMVLPRDFVVTHDGLAFAVVDDVIEDGRVLGTLRYAPDGQRLRKLGSEDAEALLRDRYPAYRYYSARLDVSLHAVPESQVLTHHSARARLSEFWRAGGGDALQSRLVRLLRVFAGHGLAPSSLGISGSLLIGAHGAGSDLDLVAYDRRDFDRARAIIARALESGEFDPLAEDDWRDAYARRGCELSYAEYVWHERRKDNKAMYEGTKFDLSLVTCRGDDVGAVPWRKLGGAHLRATVVDASASFDYPASYRIDDPDISEIVAYSQTYAGQARDGESIDVAGIVEQDAAGRRRLIVGAGREARGAYLRVVAAGAPGR